MSKYNHRIIIHSLVVEHIIFQGYILYSRLEADLCLPPMGATHYSSVYCKHIHIILNV